MTRGQFRLGARATINVALPNIIMRESCVMEQMCTASCVQCSEALKIRGWPTLQKSTNFIDFSQNLSPQFLHFLSFFSDTLVSSISFQSVGDQYFSNLKKIKYIDTANTVNASMAGVG